MSNFEADCTAINLACLRNPQTVLATGVMVLLSIRQPFYTIGRMMDDVKQHGEKSQYLWGFKRVGYKYLLDNYKGIHDLVTRYDNGLMAHDAFVHDLMAVPGMGIAKASFFAQLLVGEGACLDSHNLATLGLGTRAFDFDKGASTPENCYKKIAKYERTWRSVGDSAYWWNAWCDTVASIHNDYFANGAEVSALHRVALRYAFDDNEAPF